MSSDIFNLKNLHVSVADTSVLKGVNLEVKPGEIHAIMGPNGSGKSTLAYSLAGHPGYEVSQGEVTLDGQPILDLSPDERSQAGLFLAFQYPVEVPGVRVQNFLRLAHQARFADQPDKLFGKVLDFRKHLEALAATLGVKKEFLSRGLNEGFSGGEKKRLEILQMATIEPKYAILDETDSGLDIDAIKAVAQGVRHVVDTYHTGVIVITHYQRILEYLRPDFVHVLVDGVIAESGGSDVITKIEQHGYQPYSPKK
jgi:Fe-S cluster assembly ATP-binding protein